MSNPSTDQDKGYITRTEACGGRNAMQSNQRYMRKDTMTPVVG